MQHITILICIQKIFAVPEQICNYKANVHYLLINLTLEEEMKGMFNPLRPN